MSDVYPFLVRALQINYLLRGFNHSRQWTQCREGASTIISEEHIFTEYPEGEHFHIKSLPDHEGVLEHLFSRIDVYLFLLISKVLEF